MPKDFRYLTTLDHFQIEFTRLPQPELRAPHEHAIDCLLARYSAEPWSKACGCGRTHSLAAWIALPLVGHQKDDVEDLELKDCQCGSTLAVLLLPDGRRVP
jgi:hypothetical protein